MSDLIKHKYVSTYCLHDLHQDCRRVCKHCTARCLCWCHENQQPVMTVKDEDADT